MKIPHKSGRNCARILVPVQCGMKIGILWIFFKENSCYEEQILYNSYIIRAQKCQIEWHLACVGSVFGCFQILIQYVLWTHRYLSPVCMYFNLGCVLTNVIGLLCWLKYIMPCKLCTLYWFCKLYILLKY